MHVVNKCHTLCGILNLRIMQTTRFLRNKEGFNKHFTGIYQLYRKEPMAIDERDIMGKVGKRLK